MRLIMRIVLKVTSLSILFGLSFLIFFAPSKVLSTERLKVGEPAPEWVISEWINSNPLTLRELRGKVVVIDFFQLWCPGCNNFSIPLMFKWEKKFKDYPDIRFISIHTVFEGHDYQSPKRLKAFVKEKGINHPVGIDSYVSDRRLPETMIRYQTRGTPEMAVIDKNGILRFKRFGGFDTKEAESLIKSLLK